MKKFLFSAIFMCSFFLSAQNFNGYKYIIVPKKFNSFKEADQYRTSALIKFLFTKKGYTVVYDDDLPQDLKSNRCLGLLVDLKDESSMFTTKAGLLLKDCNSDQIFETAVAKSKQKEYQKSYSEAIRNAFKSFDTISYSYQPKEEEKQNSAPVVVSFKNDVKKVEEKEIVSASEEKQVQVSSTAKAEVVIATDVLYAQEIPNGFQLVDSTPKIEYKIYKTTVQDYYIATNNTLNGVVINKTGKWFFEYYQGDKLMSKELEIKF
ncbi:hypothetical protein M4I21_04540 [Cellulophaga sp. 20_2_10]|uniref:hypothetical protein n=1 Tax=Cellulophaga sp. 20_2_10 TaxID=2942476 RepID=UPI00201A5F45|nr:hypothetical protein [Cellulophaga sp. 20_2_10]MCL5245063.1 hypothetical protein [Cellulophaga sp. 20_2_10]